MERQLGIGDVVSPDPAIAWGDQMAPIGHIRLHHGAIGPPVAPLAESQAVRGYCTERFGKIVSSNDAYSSISGKCTRANDVKIG